MPRQSRSDHADTVRAGGQTGAESNESSAISKAPIDVNSDSFVGDLETKVGTYVGNVVVTQTDYKMRADKVNVNIVNGQPEQDHGLRQCRIRNTVRNRDRRRWRL